MTQIGFIDGVGGKQVVTLVILITGCVYTFFALADGVGDDGLERFDTAFLLYFRQPGNLAEPLGPHWLQQTMLEITTLGGYPVLMTLVAAVAGFLLISRNYGLALFVLASVVSGAGQGPRAPWRQPAGTRNRGGARNRQARRSCHRRS